MADETDTTSEVARVLREHFDPTGTDRNDPYAAAVYEEAAAALAEAGLLRPQIATQEPAGSTQGGSGDSRASGGPDAAATDACGAKSEPFLIRDSNQKPIHYLVKTCHLPAGHGRPHHWPVLTFVTPGFTEVAP